MSLYSVQFLKDIHHLGVEGKDELDVSFVEGGYLFLASEEGEEIMRENHALQWYNTIIRIVVHRRFFHFFFIYRPTRTMTVWLISTNLFYPHVANLEYMWSCLVRKS